MIERTDRLIFWDVDTQFDFMTPPDEGGQLYVKDPNDDHDPGARQIVPALARLSSFARERGILRVATGDWHTLTHREIDAEHPNFRDTFPPHCMAGEQGSEKIPETALRRPIILPLRASDDEAREAARLARRHGRDIFLHKEEFSCFDGNPATGALLEALDPEPIVVYGVALDVCVRWAVEGMLDRGYAVLLVEDATWGLGIEDEDALVARWAARGMRRTTVHEIAGNSAS